MKETEPRATPLTLASDVDESGELRESSLPPRRTLSFASSGCPGVFGQSLLPRNERGAGDALDRALAFSRCTAALPIVATAVI